MLALMLAHSSHIFYARYTVHAGLSARYSCSFFLIPFDALAFHHIST